LSTLSETPCKQEWRNRPPVGAAICTVFGETFLPFAMLAAIGSTAKTALKVDIAHGS
jgi:hypothetical protein